MVRERRRVGLGVDRLASYSASSANSIQRVEDGKLCTIATLAKIAATMDCEVAIELKPRLQLFHAARDLTPMERSVLRAYRTAGNRTKAASRLNITTGTLEVHSSAIRAKLGAPSLTDALAFAISRGIFYDPNDETRIATES